MLRKILAIVTGILMISALAGCAAGEISQNNTSEEVYFELPEKFAGVVVAHGEQTVQAEDGKAIGKMMVKEGDTVKAGQTLFTYDMDSAALTLEKASLELEQLNNDLTAKQSNRDQLIAEKDMVSGSDQLSYTIEIQQCETEIRECQYNITLKQKEVDKLKAAMEVSEVTAPVAGRIKNVKEGTSDGESTTASSVTIIEDGSYRVKGYVNENNAGMLWEGLEVTVLSRNSDETWSGMISTIDWENPSQSTQNNYSIYEKNASEESDGSDSLTSSSRYPFYVELDSSEGLLLGQHVYIETSEGAE